MSGFSHDIAGGNGSLIITSLHSPDYVPGVSGWAIFKDGSVEFNNGTFRGTVTASTIDIVGNTSSVVIDGTTGVLTVQSQTAGYDVITDGKSVRLTNPNASNQPGFTWQASPLGLVLTGPDTGQGATTLELVAGGSLLLNSAIEWIAPSGDTTGAADIANINNALAAGITVKLLPGGHYYINAPIVPKTGSRLDGGMWWSASANDNYSAGVGASGGALITMVPAFTGIAAINMTNSAVGQQNYGVDISGITIEGFSVPAGTIYGIYVDGAWGACFLRGVCIHRPPADCIRFVTDATTGKIPDDWVITQCKFSASRNGYGVYAQDLADSWWSECESSENALDGWYINYGIGTRFTACKGENNSGAGFHMTGIAANQTQWLTACGTHLNLQDGFLFDNAGPSGGGLGTYVLTGCIAENDGQTAAAGYAGFRSSGCKSRVVLTGCSVDVNATGPQYGASEVGTSYGLAATGCNLQGVTAATHDDGTNTHALSSLVPVPF